MKFYKQFDMEECGLIKSLDRCRAGRVTRVEVPGAEGLRLMEMGLIPGTRVQVLRRAPFGDPIQIILRGYALTLRRSMAAAILVETDR